jgi:vacuolar-type H+-ATPase subunit E/Vma4
VTEQQRDDKMRDAINEAAFQLTRLRRCSKREALSAVSASYRENLRDSLTTSDESYWRAMLAIAQELAGATP